MKPIHFGKYVSYWMQKTPRRLLHALSYYTFAANLIGTGKRVLELGCNEGIGSAVFAKECGFCLGVDFDAEAIASATSNFNAENCRFEVADFFSLATENWDAIVSFDVIEHIYPEHAPLFLEKITQFLKKEGLAVIGTPSHISQQFASAISKKGHINIYTHERLLAEMNRFFEFVFLFSAHDELVHTGYYPLAHYFIAVGCKPKK